MNNGFLLKFVRIWWAGVKVFFRWSAFWIVLVILWFPAMVLTGLVGNYVGYVLGTIFFILTVPFVFYLTSKYLLLLGDDDRDVADGEKSPPRDGPRSKRRMRDKIVISTGVAFCISFLLGPPDFISQYAVGFMAAFLCGVPLLILARTNFVRSSPSSMHTLICILVCTVSVLSVQWAYHGDFPDFRQHSFSGHGFTFADLWGAYSESDGQIEGVICSVDSPNSWGSGIGTKPWKLTFSDGDSVEFVIINQQTVWIDEQHRVTFLGPVLDKDDVSLMRKNGYDEESKISTPDELLAIVEKLRAEQTAPLEAASY